MNDDLLVEVVSAVVLLILAGATIYVNVWNYRRRSKRTPEERSRDDAEQ